MKFLLKVLECHDCEFVFAIEEGIYKDLVQAKDKVYCPGCGNEIWEDDFSCLGSVELDQAEQLKPKKLLLTKENHVNSYASTEEDPSDGEIEYVYSILDWLNEQSYDNFTSHAYCHIECECKNNDISVYDWRIVIPEEVAGMDPEEDDERILSVIQCSNCGKWALCD